MTEYIVLRNRASVASIRPIAPPARTWEWSAAPFETVSKPMREIGFGSGQIAERARPSIDVLDLQPHEVGEIAAQPGVVGVGEPMPVSLIDPFADQGEPGEGDAWGVGAVAADASAWTGDGVTVAILDTGIDREHPAFAGMEIVEKDFIGEGAGDANGHGTHCAGTAFGRDVEGRRIGIARGVRRALIGKVLNRRGRGTSKAIFDAIIWAMQEKARVVSMSLGFDFPGAVAKMVGQGYPAELATSLALVAYRSNLRMFDALMQMVRSQEAFDEGTVVVAAAGNESKIDEDPKFRIAASLPAAAEGVISVGALRRDAEKFAAAPFSNRFPQISAPGVGIVSARSGGGLKALSGTSMACPHVAGIAALWWEAIRKGGSVTPKATAVIAQLRATARANVFVAGAQGDDRGAGIVTAPPAPADAIS